jgi:hypothetical protein
MPGVVGGGGWDHGEGGFDRNDFWDVPLTMPPQGGEKKVGLCPHHLL